VHTPNQDNAGGSGTIIDALSDKLLGGFPGAEGSTLFLASDLMRFDRLPHEDESKNDWAAVEDSEETPRPGSLHTDYSVIVRPPLRDEVIPLAAEVIGSHILVAGLGKVALAPEAVARDLIAANVPFERLEVHASTRLL
jgi:hypothetical protein